VSADNADAAVPFIPLTGSKISFGTLLSTTFLLMGWVETKRWYDFKSPGSQGDGSFLGFTDELKGKENGYPGGRWFDPFGLSRGSEAQYKRYKENEIKNGRLAMVAMLGFWSQYGAFVVDDTVVGCVVHVCALCAEAGPFWPRWGDCARACGAFSLTPTTPTHSVTTTPTLHTTLHQQTLYSRHGQGPDRRARRAHCRPVPRQRGDQRHQRALCVEIERA
jgi:hypothetical protein